MLGISLQETRFYQDVKEEGREEGKQVGKEEGRQEEARTFVLRLLTKRFGEVSSEFKSQISRLSLEQLEALGEALLDFVSFDDLAVWLETENGSIQK
jgi:predicted transposase YdaD